MRKATPILFALIGLAACDAPKRGAMGTPIPVSPAQADSAYLAANPQVDSATADPMITELQFVSQPNGGDIILERGIHEDMGINQIRAHLLLLARSFSRGDFALPGFTSTKPVPGIQVMTDRADKISYDVEDLPHGGVVHIVTDDPAALQAVHSFIDFQAAEHKPTTPPPQ